MSIIRNLSLSFRKVGVVGTCELILKKYRKRRELKSLLAVEPLHASLRDFQNRTAIELRNELTEKERTEIVAKADEMLSDRNYFFMFPYQLSGVESPWNYDPIEKKYWQKKRYEETSVHTVDSPRDVKIVWEINRFKDLPVLAQAAYITHDAKYAEEVKRRIHSWIEDNSFARTINWSSPLELGVRALSWTAALVILDRAGFDVVKHERIQSSIWQHAIYLNAELSIDKIVRSNHLIGETCGLYVLASLFDFPQAESMKRKAKDVFIDSILEQTYPDGASRESSGWYHTFVSDFADIFLRTAKLTADILPDSFVARFEKIQTYRNSITATDGAVVKFGDFDNGKAIELGSKWRTLVFGNSFEVAGQPPHYYSDAKHVTARIGNQYLFVRCGEFGWGGDGFSSHAHDDLLSPVFNFDKKMFLVDPGTYVYNGDKKNRDAFRSASMHNGLIIGARDAQPVMKPSFGWLKGRKDAVVHSFNVNDEFAEALCSYGEWASEHKRLFRLHPDGLVIVDDFTLRAEQPVEWNFHFHPRWQVALETPKKAIIRDFRDFRFVIELSQGEAEFEVRPYDFSPSYMVKSEGQKIHIAKTLTTQPQQFRFEITRSS